MGDFSQYKGTVVGVPWDIFITNHKTTFFHQPNFETLRTFTGVETVALTFRTKQYSTSYSIHICYGKRFYNDFFLNHHTIALVNNFLKLLNCVVTETALDLVKKESIILTVSFQLENVPF